MYYYIALLLIAFVHTTHCQMGDEWVTTIDEEFQDVTFYCNSSEQTIPPNFYPELWMLPDLTNIDKNFSDGRISVLDNGYRLDVRNASRYDLGLYHCMTWDGSEWYLIKLGLNSRGPYFEDTWEKYETGTIVGISACFGFLAAAFLIWAVVANQWVAPEGWYEDEKEDRAKSGVEEGHTNLAFKGDPLPEGAKGYVEVRDKVEVQKKSPELKARHVLNGNPSVVAKGNGKIEMEEKYNEEKETGHNMITEL